MYIFRQIIMILNFVVTIGASTMLILSYFSSVISPASIWWLSMIAIVAPALVVVTLITFLVNLIRAKLLAVVPLVALVLGIGKITGQFNYVFFKEYDLPANSIKIVTHNVRLFLNDKWNNVLDSTVTMVKKTSPDIIAIQEFHASSSVGSDSLKTLFGSFTNYSTALFGGKTTGQGLAIFSKFPIIKKDKLLFDDDMRGMQWVDVVTKYDTLRIFNIHMKSNEIDRSEKILLSGNSVDLSDISHLKSILKKVKLNAEIRSFYSDTISKIIEESPYKVIVCGDLNDVPFSYTYRAIKGDLNDTFSKRGNLFAYSYNQLYKLLKIDYIFTPNGYTVGRYSSFDTSYSDHNPIIVDIYKEK